MMRVQYGFSNVIHSFVSFPFLHKTNLVIMYMYVINQDTIIICYKNTYKKAIEYDDDNDDDDDADDDD